MPNPQKFLQLIPADRQAIRSFIERYESALQGVLEPEQLRELLAGYQLAYPSWRFISESTNCLVPGSAVEFRKVGISATSGILIAMAIKSESRQEIGVIWRPEAQQSHSVDRPDIRLRHQPTTDPGSRHEGTNTEVG